MRRLFLGLLLLHLLVVGFCQKKAGNVILHNVPYHRQYTTYSCGDGSLEMVLHSYGQDVDQRAIIDVLRTSQGDGTFSFDIVRGGHFSSLSSAPTGIYFPFPEQVPHNGWNVTRPLGYGSFMYRSTDCWTEQLKLVLNEHSPIIVLMWYDNTFKSGHYRVVIGYDSTVDSFILLDPWDREGQPRRLTLNSTEFCVLWAHAEIELGQKYLPYAAFLLTPWRVSVSYDVNAKGNLTVSAEIEYVCPTPFCNSQHVAEAYNATNAFAVLTLPNSLKLGEGQSNKIPLQTVRPGDIRQVTWEVIPDNSVTVYERGHIIVQASGIVKGSIPAKAGFPSPTVYPAYNYQDQIGGTGKVDY